MSVEFCSLNSNTILVLLRRLLVWFLLSVVFVTLVRNCELIESTGCVGYFSLKKRSFKRAHSLEKYSQEEDR